jgi:hypothetical protein
MAWRGCGTRVPPKQRWRREQITEQIKKKNLQETVQAVFRPVGENFLSQGSGGIYVELARPEHAQHADILAAEFFKELLAAWPLSESERAKERESERAGA